MAKPKTDSELVKERLDFIRKDSLTIVKNVTRFQNGKMTVKELRQSILTKSNYVRNDVMFLMDKGLLE